MATSQRLSRGFHRLALFLAAIPMLFRVIFSAYFAYEDATQGLARHKNSGCVYAFMKSNGKKFWEIYFASPDGRINLKQIGCSVTDYESISADEIPSGPPAFGWLGTFNSLALSLGITLTVSLATYGIVRAIGWVISGFAAS